jgi:hypothetical protein
LRSPFPVLNARYPQAPPKSLHVPWTSCAFRDTCQVPVDVGVSASAGRVGCGGCAMDSGRQAGRRLERPLSAQLPRGVRRAATCTRSGCQRCNPRESTEFSRVDRSDMSWARRVRLSGKKDKPHGAQGDAPDERLRGRIICVPPPSDTNTARACPHAHRGRTVREHEPGQSSRRPRSTARDSPRACSARSPWS